MPFILIAVNLNLISYIDKWENGAISIGYTV